MSRSEMLLYGGILIMVATALAGLAAIVIFRHCGKRLNARLEQEFGKQRH